MEKVPKIKLENKENAVLRVVVFRHGPKLSAAGEKNALAEYFSDSVRCGYQAADIEDGEGLAHVATSGVQRAVDTANIIKDEIGSSDHRQKDHIVHEKKLEVPMQPLNEKTKEDELAKRYAKDLETIVEMQKEIQQGVRDAVEKELLSLDQEAKEAEIRNRIDMIVLSRMFEDSEKPEEERKIKTSYGELANIFGARYLGFSRHLNFLENLKNASEAQFSDEPYLQADVTHSFPVACFLKKYLVFDDGKKAEEMSSQEFFERTGGIIRESGSFQMDFINSNPLRIEVEGEFEQGKVFQGVINISEIKNNIEKIW